MMNQLDDGMRRKNEAWNTGVLRNSEVVTTQYDGERISIKIQYPHKYEFPYQHRMCGSMVRVKGGGWRMKPYPL